VSIPRVVYPELSRVVRDSLCAAGILELYPAAPDASARTAAAAADLATTDLMALGALADALRAAEVGAHVRVRVVRGGDAPLALAVVQGEGLGLLRAVAIARIAGPVGTTVAVDWTTARLELSQVALGFGANALVGVLSNKRGLPIAEDARRKVKGQGMVALAELQRREIERVLRGARRIPDFGEEPEENTHDTHAGN
jgi:hypothetical protein